MVAAILIIMSMIFLDVNKTRGFQFRPLSKINFYIFIAIFLALLILGAKHVETPYIEIGQLFTLAYFSYFLIIIPVVSHIENLAIINYISTVR
jgi:ubiquinol-cytochrome c reductase cytochrome b subunit